MGSEMCIRDRGITVEILFFRSRGEEVRMTFQKQMVDVFQPDVYLFNRNLGTLRLVPLMPLSLWLETDEDYDDLLKDT